MRALPVSALRDVILSFYGCVEAPTWYSVSARLKQYAVNGSTISDLIRLLIRASFLGVELNHEKHFAYSEADSSMLAMQALSGKSGFLTRPRLPIHAAFHSGLKLKQSASRTPLIHNLIEGVFHVRLDR